MNRDGKGQNFSHFYECKLLIETPTIGLPHYYYPGQRFCVVSHGEGYFVKAHTPTEWEQIRVVPIIDVRCVRAQGIIVFANFTELIAYDQTGVKWRTKRLTWDDLKIAEVTDTYIRGEFSQLQLRGPYQRTCESIGRPV